FFNPTPTTVIYTLSLHDALPICYSSVKERGGLEEIPHLRPDFGCGSSRRARVARCELRTCDGDVELHRALQAAGRSLGCCGGDRDRKSTRLNSSHVAISYAVFCL